MALPCKVFAVIGMVYCSLLQASRVCCMLTDDMPHRELDQRVGLRGVDIVNQRRPPKFLILYYHPSPCPRVRPNFQNHPFPDVRVRILYLLFLHITFSNYYFCAFFVLTLN